MEPFTGQLFYGAECFFLLDMGIVAAQRLPRLKNAGSFLIGFAIFMPLFNSFIGVFVEDFYLWDLATHFYLWFYVQAPLI